MNIIDLIELSFAVRLTTTLLHFLWQGCVLGLLALAGQSLLRRAAAGWRYRLHIVVLLAMAACVPATFSLVDAPLASVVSSEGSPVESDARQLDARSPVASELQPVPTLLEPAPAEDFGADSARPRRSPELVEGAVPGSVRATNPASGLVRVSAGLVVAMQPWARYVTLGYFACCALLLARLAHGVLGGQRLRSRATPVTDSSLLAAVHQQATRLGLKAMPAVAWCAEVSIPVVVGVVKPMILLPAAATTGLTLDQLQTLLTHELAHIRRYDLLVNLVQRIVDTMLFFHPAVWYVSRRIRSEREQACDELVLATGCPRVLYADSLVRMAELASVLDGRKGTPAGGMAASGSSPTEFKRRVLKVLAIEESRRLWPGKLALVMMLSVVLLAIAAPALWKQVTSAAPAQRDDEVGDKSMSLKRPRPDAAITNPAAKGRELAGADSTAAPRADPPAAPLTPRTTPNPEAAVRPTSPADVSSSPVLIVAPEEQQAAHQRIIDRLPDWLKPLYGRGLSATLDDDGEVINVQTGDVLTDELLERLSGLPQLRELHMETTKRLTLSGLAHLAKMTRLESLSLMSVHREGAALGDAAIESVAGLDSLRELSISECGTTDAGAKRLEQLTRLTSLSLRQEGKLTDQTLRSIGKLTRLESLALDSYVGTQRFGWMRFSADGVRHLSGLTELRSLHLVGHEVPADALNFPKLNSLSLGHPMVGDVVVKKVGELRSLTSLKLVYCGISDRGMAEVAKLAELRSLEISSGQLTDTAFEPFRTHSKLEHLLLRVGGVTDKTLGYVAQIKSIERLDLYGSGQAGVAPGRNFSSNGLKSLVQLPNLQTLWLSNFQLGGGYGVLKDLKQLRTLSMMMCDVRVDELELLEAALPEARIGHMTGGGGWTSKRFFEPVGPPARRAAVPVADGNAVDVVNARNEGPNAQAGMHHELLRMLVRGGKISTDSVNAGVTLVAARAAQDSGFAKIVLAEFEKCCVSGERTTRWNRPLLAVITRMFEAWSSRRWREQLAPFNPNDVPQVVMPNPGDKFESDALALVIRHARHVRATDRSNIGDFTLAVRALHHPQSKSFLRDVLQNPESTANPFGSPGLRISRSGTKTAQSLPLPDFEAPAVPNAGSGAAAAQGKWSDNIGGQWTDAKFVAAVGLAELGDVAGTEWLIANARPSDFGTGRSLWHHPHFRDRSGAMQISCHESLVDLLGRTESTFAELQQAWKNRGNDFRARRVLLKPGK